MEDSERHLFNMVEESLRISSFTREISSLEGEPTPSSAGKPGTVHARAMAWFRRLTLSERANVLKIRDSNWSRVAIRMYRSTNAAGGKQGVYIFNLTGMRPSPRLRRPCAGHTVSPQYPALSTSTMPFRFVTWESFREKGTGVPRAHRSYSGNKAACVVAEALRFELSRASGGGISNPSQWTACLDMPAVESAAARMGGLDRLLLAAAAEKCSREFLLEVEQKPTGRKKSQQHKRASPKHTFEEFETGRGGAARINREMKLKMARAGAGLGSDNIKMIQRGRLAVFSLGAFVAFRLCECITSAYKQQTKKGRAGYALSAIDYRDSHAAARRWGKMDAKQKLKLIQEAEAAAENGCVGSEALPPALDRESLAKCVSGIIVNAFRLSPSAVDAEAGFARALLVALHARTMLLEEQAKAAMAALLDLESKTESNSQSAKPFRGSKKRRRKKRKSKRGGGGVSAGVSDRSATDTRNPVWDMSHSSDVHPKAKLNTATTTAAITASSGAHVKPETKLKLHDGKSSAAFRLASCDTEDAETISSALVLRLVARAAQQAENRRRRRSRKIARKRKRLRHFVSSILMHTMTRAVVSVETKWQRLKAAARRGSPGCQARRRKALQEFRMMRQSGGTFQSPAIRLELDSYVLTPHCVNGRPGMRQLGAKCAVRHRWWWGGTYPARVLASEGAQTGSDVKASTTPLTVTLHCRFGDRCLRPDCPYPHRSVGTASDTASDVSSDVSSDMSSDMSSDSVAPKTQTLTAQPQTTVVRLEGTSLNTTSTSMTLEKSSTTALATLASSTLSRESAPKGSPRHESLFNRRSPHLPLVLSFLSSEDLASARSVSLAWRDAAASAKKVRKRTRGTSSSYAHNDTSRDVKQSRFSIRSFLSYFDRPKGENDPSATPWSAAPSSAATWDTKGPAASALNHSMASYGAQYAMLFQSFGGNIAILRTLTKEINQFSSALQALNLQRRSAQMAVINAVRTSLRSLWPSARVQVYGSFATRLCVPSSDVDVVVSDAQTPHDMHISLAELTSRLARHLRREKWIKRVQTIGGAALRIVKATACVGVVPVHIDISFHSSQHKGLSASGFVRGLCVEYPDLIPLALVLKQFLVTKRINNPYTGGLSSYGIVLMVASLLQRDRTFQRYLAAAYESSRKTIHAGDQDLKRIATPEPDKTTGEPNTERAWAGGRSSPVDVKDAKDAIVAQIVPSKSPKASSPSATAHTRSSSGGSSSGGSSSDESVESVAKRCGPLVTMLPFLKQGAFQRGAELGRLFLLFLDTFGMRFDPQLHAVSASNTAEVPDFAFSGAKFRHMFRNHSMVIVDPFDSTNNIGRTCFNVWQIQQVFATALNSVLDRFARTPLARGPKRSLLGAAFSTVHHDNVIEAERSRWHLEAPVRKHAPAVSEQRQLTAECQEVLHRKRAVMAARIGALTEQIKKRRAMNQALIDKAEQSSVAFERLAKDMQSQARGDERSSASKAGGGQLQQFMSTAEDLTSYLAWLNEQKRANHREIAHLNTKIEHARAEFAEALGRVADTFGAADDQVTINQVRSMFFTPVDDSNQIIGKDRKQQLLLRAQSVNALVHRKTETAAWRIAQLQEDIEEMEQMTAALAECAQYQSTKLAMRKLKQKQQRSAAQQPQELRSDMKLVDECVARRFKGRHIATVRSPSRVEAKQDGLHAHALNWCPDTDDPDADDTDCTTEYLAWLNQQNRVNHQKLSILKARVSQEKQQYALDLARLTAESLSS